VQARLASSQQAFVATWEQAHVVVTDDNDRLSLARDMRASRIVNVQREAIADVVSELKIEGLTLAGDVRQFSCL
jgi:hypothetical protein